MNFGRCILVDKIQSDAIFFKVIHFISEKIFCYMQKKNKKNVVWAALVCKEPTITTLRVVNLLWIIAEIFIKIDGTIRIFHIYNTHEKF